MEKDTESDQSGVLANLGSYRWVLAPLAAITGIILYAYSLGTVFSALGVHPDFAADHGLRPVVERFGSSLVFLGILPLVGALLAGFKPANLGLASPGKFLKDKLFVAVWALLVGVSLLGSMNPELQSFYPYWKQYGNPALPGVQFLLYPLAYLVLYYIPWELCFRGVLLAPLLASGARLAGTSAADSRAVLGWVMLSTATSALLHFGHPLSETISALVWGIISCLFTLKYRSIVPAILVHSTVGIALDIALAAGWG